jgi:hypothetical protein
VVAALGARGARRLADDGVAARRARGIDAIAARRRIADAVIEAGSIRSRQRHR